MDYLLIKNTLAALAILGLYSVLYKENKLFRFWEHVFLGLAAGYSVVAMWTDTLKPDWWDKLVGKAPDAHGAGGAMGYPMYLVLLPIGLMAYTLFSRKHNWLGRVPIGIILGLYSGQQFNAWMNRYTPQIANSMLPVIPTTWTLFKPPTEHLRPTQLAEINSTVYWSQALTNLIFVITVLSVLSYFLFSFDVKSKLIHRMSLNGRWLLMIGFGAIFGSTVMMRFTLVIDRMYFIWIEWFQQGILKGLLHL